MLRGSSQRGTYHVLMAVLAVPLIGLIALAVDGFFIMTFDVQQDSNAEYSALAAIKEFRELGSTPYSTKVSLATNKAARVAGLNFYVGNKGASQMPGATMNPQYGTIAFGHIVGSGFRPAVDATDFAAFAGRPEAVSITLTTTASNSLKTTFANILKLSQVNSTSSAIGYFDPVAGYVILR